MEQKMKENTVMNNQYVQQLVGNKKKAVMAAVLIIVMIMMWIKVFVADSPGAAKAQTETTSITKQANEQPEVKITFVELPDVNGQNDAITRDFFSMQPENMKKAKDNSILNDQADGYIKRIAEKLRLETIVMAENSQAFINGKLFSKGDVLTVKDGSKTYKCEVVEIKQNSVLIMCDREQIKLKLATFD